MFFREVTSAYLLATILVIHLAYMVYCGTPLPLVFAVAALDDFLVNPKGFVRLMLSSQPTSVHPSSFYPASFYPTCSQSNSSQPTSEEELNVAFTLSYVPVPPPPPPDLFKRWQFDTWLAEVEWDLDHADYLSIWLENQVELKLKEDSIL